MPMHQKFGLLFLVLPLIVGSCSTEKWILPIFSPGLRLTVDCSGERKYSTVVVDDYPIAVLCRSQEDLNALKQLDKQVFSPENEEPNGRFRSVRKDVFIALGVNFHGGCTVDFVPRGNKWPEASWLGGFHSLCHGEVFDMAGRQIKPGKFSPTKVPKFVGKLIVPKYRYISENEIEFL